MAETKLRGFVETRMQIHPWNGLEKLFSLPCLFCGLVTVSGQSMHEARNYMEPWKYSNVAWCLVGRTIAYPKPVRKKYAAPHGASEAHR